MSPPRVLHPDSSIIRDTRRLGTSLAKNRALLPPKKDYRNFTLRLPSAIEGEWLLDYHRTHVYLCKNCILCRLADRCKPSLRKPRGMAREPQARAEICIPGQSYANCQWISDRSAERQEPLAKYRPTTLQWASRIDDMAQGSILDGNGSRC